MSAPSGIVPHVPSLAIKLLDRRLYSFSDVDRLLLLTAGTARRWIDGYERRGQHYDPVLRPESTSDERVTWGELVECRLLAEYRNERVPLQNLRPAVVRLRDLFGRYPLARSRPYVDVEGRELVMRVQQEVGLDAGLSIVVVRNDQLLLSDEAARFERLVEFRDDVITGLTPTDVSPSVRLDPERAYGQPSVRSVRTEILAEDYRAGATTADLARLYELSLEQVEDALRYELIAHDRTAA